MMRRLLLVIATGMLLPACSFSKSGGEDDLDVEMRPSPDGPSSTKVRKPEAGEPTAVDVPASALFDWQKFFKRLPSKSERPLLEARLTGWDDDADPTQLLKKARIELALGKLKTAEVSLQKALRQDQHSQEVRLELASLFIRTRRLEDAFVMLGEIRDDLGLVEQVDHSLLFRYRYVLALAYLARGDREKGHGVLSDLIGLDKSFAPAYIALATSYIRDGKTDVAEFVLERGLDRTKSNAELYNLKGVIAAGKKHYDAARSWFEKALELDGNHVAALVNRAGLSVRQFEYGAAEEDLKKAVTIDPSNADAMVALGVVYRRQGQITAARGAFSKAIDLSPRNAHARYNLAVLMADDLGEPHQALRLFQEVLQTPDASKKIKDLARSHLIEVKTATQSY